MTRIPAQTPPKMASSSWHFFDPHFANIKHKARLTVRARSTQRRDLRFILRTGVFLRAHFLQLAAQF